MRRMVLFAVPSIPRDFNEILWAAACTNVNFVVKMSTNISNWLLGVLPTSVLWYVVVCSLVSSRRVNCPTMLCSRPTASLSGPMRSQDLVVCVVGCVTPRWCCCVCTVFWIRCRRRRCSWYVVGFWRFSLIVVKRWYITVLIHMLDAVGRVM